MAAYWIGADGNIWYKGDDGRVVNRGSANDLFPGGQLMDSGVSGHKSGSFAATRIEDPNPPQQPSTGGGSGGSTYDPQAALDAAERARLRGEISGKAPELDALYASLFGDLDNLVRSRDMELEDQYGGQIKKATEDFTTAIPTIESSYAALGSGDSTDRSDAKTKAKKGFDETTQTIGKNKQADKAKLGQYSNEQRAKFTVDRDSAKRNIDRAGTTEDVGALRGLRNDIESNLDTARVSRATLGTDQGARGEVSRITADNGRFQSAINALDEVIKSSMSGSVKRAAVEAISEGAGLSDEEKQKVRQQYGDVYAEQQTL
ncbi:hypothetical protein KC963_01885 [Candidatus Saccharibacteria bacterium]|nr:hypothetical protein [Candidatus Saccharibacteria bacterium]